MVIKSFGWGVINNTELGEKKLVIRCLANFTSF